jgi:Flp pilus assembly protein TadG
VFTKWRPRKLQRGAAALEFAIIVPIFMLLVCAMIDFAMVFNAQAVTANAARDGARAASLGKTFATTGTTIANETSSLINSSSVSWSVCTAATIDAATWTCSSAAGDAAYDNARTTGAIVKVTVSYRYTWITALPNLVGLGATTNVSQASYMRIETTS